MPTNKIFPLLDSGSHLARIEGLFAIPEKEQIISVGREGTVRILNAKTGATLRINSLLKENCGDCLVFASALSPDGNILAIGGHLSNKKNEIWLIDLTHWVIEKILDGHQEGVKVLAFSKEGKWLVSGGHLGDIKIWSTIDYQARRLPKVHQADILDISIGKDARFIISTDRAGTLLLWTQVDNGNYKSKSLIGHNGIPISIAIAPDESFFVTADIGRPFSPQELNLDNYRDATNKIGGKLIGWDIQGNPLWSNRDFFPTFYPLGAVSISPNNRFVAFKEDDTQNVIPMFKVHILDLKTMTIVSSYDYHQDLITNTFFYDNETLISANSGMSSLLLTDWKNKQIQKQWHKKEKRISKISLETPLTLHLAFQPAYKKKVANDLPTELPPYNSDKKNETESILGLLETFLKQRTPNSINQGGISFSFKTQQLEVTDNARTTSPIQYFEGNKLIKGSSHTLSVVGGQTIYFEDKLEGRIQDYFFTNEGNIVVLGDYLVKYFDNKGQLIRTFGKRAAELRAASISPDNQYLSICGTDQITQLYNLQTGELLASFYVNAVNEWVLWSPLGYYTCSTNGANLLTWFESNKKQLPTSASDKKTIQHKFHQPKLLNNIISLGSAEKALQTNKKTIAPSIKLQETPTTTRQEELEINLNIEAVNQIAEIQILLNEKIIFNQNYLKPNTVIQLKESINLEAGANNLSIIVKDRVDNKTIKNKAIFYDTTPKVLLSSGHTASISNIAYSIDGKYVASTSADNTLKIWNLNTGQLRHVLDYSNTNEFLNNSIDGAAFHPYNANKICVFSGSKLHVFDLATGNIIQTFFSNDIISNLNTIKGVTYSKDGQYILSIDRTGKLRYWNTQTTQEDYTFQIHEGIATSLATTIDKKYLATQGEDNFLTIFDIEQRQIVQRIPLAAKVTDYDLFGAGDFIDISKDQSSIIAGGNYKDRIEVFDFKSGQKRYEIIEGKDNFTGASFSSDNKYLAISRLSNPIQVLAANTGNIIKTFPANTRSASTISFHPNHPILVSAHDNSNKFTLNAWRVPTGDLLLEIGNDVRGVTALAVSANGRYLASSGINQMLLVWDLQTLSLVAKYKVGENCMSSIGAYDLAFNANDSLLAISSCDNVIRILDLTTKKFVLSKRFNAPLRSIEFHPKKNLLALVDKSNKLWNIETNILEDLGLTKNSISKVQFNSTGDYLGTISKKEIVLWDLKKKQRVLTYATPQLTSNNPINTSFGAAGMIGQINGIDVFGLALSSKNQAIIFSSPISETIFKYDLPTAKIETIYQVKSATNKYTSLVLSSDNRYLATSKSQEHTIEIFDLQQNKLVKTLSGHQALVRKLVFDAKGQHLFSCSKDGTIKIWDWQNAKEVMSLVTSAEGNYVFNTMDNYYYSNQSEQTAINFLINSKVFPFEQFDLQLNRPDIILERLGVATNAPIAAYKKAYLKRLDKMGFSPQEVRLDFTSIPTITIRQSLVEDYTKNENYTFEVVANGGKEFIKQLNVFVNDVPIYGRKGLDYSDKKLVTINEKIELTLSNSRNKIQISATNKSGVASLKETFYINYQGIPKKTNLYLLTFGVNQYDNAPNLDFSEKDAKNIQQLFQERSTYFDKVYQYPLLGKDFSKEAILKLRKTLEKTKVDDQILIFYAGHGFLDKENDFFLTCKNTNFNTPEETGVSYETLENLLDGIPARQKLVLIDACHSGEIDEDYTAKIQTANANQKTNVKFKSTRDTGQRSPQIGMNNSFDLMKELFVDLRRGTGATVIAAARGVELAGESSLLENGFFTHAIINGLKEGEADLNQDGKITVSELKTYVSKKVTELTNGLQQPTSRLENISNDFRIW